MEQKAIVAENSKETRCLKVDDKVCFPTIDEICKRFGTQATSRGYLKVGATPVPMNDELHIWYPNTSNDKGWKNELSEDGYTLTEYHKDEEKREEHVKICIAENKVRITFLKSTEKYNDNEYHFIGIFALNIKETEAQGKCVWHKISNECCL